MKKELMILVISLFSFFVVYAMGPTQAYNHQGGLEFDDSSYIANEALPHKSVFTTPDNVYRTKHWVSDAGSGSNCYYKIDTVRNCLFK
jgi:hypothetical protein